MKAIIYFCDNRTITITNEQSFENFLKQFFKKKIYVSFTNDDTNNIAINTDNVLFVEEVQE